MAPIEIFRQKLLEAGIGADKPLHAILVEVREAAQDLTAKVEELKAQPVAQIARDVRRVLREEVAPEFRLRWKWDRWAKVAAVAMVYTTLVAGGAYFVGSRATESARLEDWCFSRAHVVVQDGKKFCQIPVS